MRRRMASSLIAGALVSCWSALAAAQAQRAAIIVDAEEAVVPAAAAATRAALAGSGIEIVPDGDLQAARLMVLGDAAAPLDDASITRLRAEMGIAFVARVQVRTSGDGLAVAIAWTTAAGAERRFASATSAELPEVIARLTGELVRAAAPPVTATMVGAPASVDASSASPTAMSTGDAIVQVISVGGAHEVTLTSGSDAWTCIPPCQLQVPAGPVLVAGRGYRAELTLSPGMMTIETRAGSDVGMIVFGAVLTAIGAIGLSVGLALWVPAETFRSATDLVTDELMPSLAAWILGATVFTLGLTGMIEGLLGLRGRARIMPTQSAARRGGAPAFALGTSSGPGPAALVNW